MGVNAGTPVSPLPKMCWFVGFRGVELAPMRNSQHAPGIPNAVFLTCVGYGAARPEPVCFKAAEGREVGLVEAGLDQLGIAARHVRPLLTLLATDASRHSGTPPRPSSRPQFPHLGANVIYPPGDVYGAGVGGVGQRPAYLHTLGGYQVDERLLIGITPLL